MPNNPLVLALLCLLAAEAVASPVDLSGIDVGELGRIQSRTILLKAQAEMAKAERDANDAGATVQAVHGASPARIESQTSDGGKQQPQSIDLPVVKAITGSSTKLQAALLFSSGVEVEAGIGRELPDGFRVQQITLEGVTLERKGQRFPLGFSNQMPVPVSPKSPAMSQPAAPLPGVTQNYP
ncbi:type IV pilus biogenesis protein PilP [Pseudomonas sp. NyZ201]|uniref:type IV pilus biogenesis protein PilP n=1 Tax=Pseudomonas sp. NyZ201 TaxID=3409857 RepID=UPI003CE7A644